MEEAIAAARRGRLWLVLELEENGNGVAGSLATTEGCAFEDVAGDDQAGGWDVRQKLARVFER